MLDDKFSQIKSAIEHDDSIDDAKRQKLLALSDELHDELNELEKTHQQQSHNIAEHAHKTVAESSQKTANGLKDTVREFEASHPNLTRIVQTLCAQFGV